MNSSIESIDPGLSVEIARCFIMALIENGVIDPRGKTAIEIMREVRAYCETREINWQSVIDHQEDLLRVATSLVEQGDKEAAVVLYATWIEHALNHIIHVASIRSKLIDRHCEAVFRDTQIRAKFIWIHLLFGDPVRDEDFDRVCLIHSVRNEFVHYKWNLSEERDEARVKGALEAVRLIRFYIEAFTHRHVNRGFDFAEIEATPAQSGAGCVMPT
jgi:hypothetical protein